MALSGNRIIFATAKTFTNMKRIAILIAIVIASVATVQAKKTYIPRYATFISITAPDEEPFTVSNINMENTVQSASGMFSLSVYHDDMTMEKLKTIRRNKAAAGWFGFSASLYFVSAILSDNIIDRFANTLNAEFAATLSAIHTANAEVASVLGIEVEIDNTSGGEIMVNDMERGLTWYILPSQSLTLRMSNPDVARLRISDGEGRHPHYATIGAGSEMKSMKVVYEDEDFVAVPIYGDGDKRETAVSYNIIDRRTWEQHNISPAEYKKFKKQRKR